MNRYYKSANGQVQDPQDPPMPDDVPDRPLPGPEPIPQPSPPIIVFVPFYKKPLFWVAVIALIIAIIAVVMYSKQNKVVYEF
jgi:hypothetical protein